LSVAKEYDSESLIVEAVVEVNRKQRERMVEKIERLVGELQGKQVAVLGLSFKPETDDMREAPSVDIIHALLAKGAKVRAYDPVAAEQARKILPEITYAEDEYAAVEGADALVFMTEWNQFRALDMSRVKELMRTPKVADLRNINEPERMRQLGFDYVGVGR
jgi:UDPglucose 6-dehydrogenase